MPNRAKKRCTFPGCPELADSGRCEDCRNARRKVTRSRTREHHYYGPAWPARRRDFLNAHPRCVLCARQASVADHYPKSRRRLLAEGIADPDAPERLRALCKPCHDRQTAIHQPGGWARDRER